MVWTVVIAIVLIGVGVLFLGIACLWEQVRRPQIQLRGLEDQNIRHLLVREVLNEIRKDLKKSGPFGR